MSDQEVAEGNTAAAPEGGDDVPRQILTALYAAVRTHTENFSPQPPGDQWQALPVTPGGQLALLMDGLGSRSSPSRRHPAHWLDEDEIQGVSSDLKIPLWPISYEGYIQDSTGPVARHYGGESTDGLEVWKIVDRFYRPDAFPDLKLDYLSFSFAGVHTILGIRRSKAPADILLIQPGFGLAPVILDYVNRVKADSDPNKFKILQQRLPRSLSRLIAGDKGSYSRLRSDLLDAMEELCSGHSRIAVVVMDGDPVVEVDAEFEQQMRARNVQFHRLAADYEGATSEFDKHLLVRRHPEILRQVRHFLQTGSLDLSAAPFDSGI